MVPDLVLDDGRRVAELLHDGAPVLLDLSGGAASAVAAALGATGWTSSTAAIADGRPHAMLIRPDGYVAWAADTFGADDAERLRAALTRWFGPTE